MCRLQAKRQSGNTMILPEGRFCCPSGFFFAVHLSPSLSRNQLPISAPVSAPRKHAADRARGRDALRGKTRATARHRTPQRFPPRHRGPERRGSFPTPIPKSQSVWVLSPTVRQTAPSALEMKAPHRQLLCLEYHTKTQSAGRWRFRYRSCYHPGRLGIAFFP
jgi:hypothetical protein